MLGVGRYQNTTPLIFNSREHDNDVKANRTDEDPLLLLSYHLQMPQNSSKHKITKHASINSNLDKNSLAISKDDSSSLMTCCMLTS